MSVWGRGNMAWNLIDTFLNKRRWRKQKERNRLERGRREYEVLSGYEDQIREETWRQLAASHNSWDLEGFKAEELLASVELRGELAVVEEFDLLYPELEFKRTWGQTQARIRRDLYLELTRRAANRPE
jgi:hypothetical protein